MVEDLSETLGVLAMWGGAAATEYGLCYPDPRLPALGLRCMLPPHLAGKAAADLGAELVDAAVYEAHRIALGVPRGGLDFIYGDAFPHETDMDQLGGVDFDKGCFVGQEVVSRIEHRGTARTRVVPVSFDGFAPEAGAPVMRRRQGRRHARLVGARPRARDVAPRSRRRRARSRPDAHRRRHRDAAGQAGLGALSHGPARRRLRNDALPCFILTVCKRCPWPKQDPLYVAYHDEEWGVPEYDDRALYEKLVLDGFQAGLSWITILRKRDNFRRAFDGFEPEKIARYTPKKVERLMQDAGIVRNRMKIEGAVRSARAYLDVMEKGPGFSRLLWDFVDGKPKVNQFSQHDAGAGGDRAVAQNLQGARGARLQVRRTDHRLRLHAGGRHGQRPLVTCHRHATLAKLAGRSMPAQPKSRRARPQPFRAWQRMLSGRRLDLLDPSPLDVEIEDIAHGLARVARWNGQTEGAHIFSVAQHSLLVEIIARQRARLDRPSRLAVLLHDAPEYVIGDMISPFKAVIGDAYKAVEARLLAAIHLRFGLPAVLPAELIALIKAADRSAAYLEATRLAGFSAAEARRFFGSPPKFSAAIERDYLTPWPAETAERRYLERFAKLAGG